ncbi:MAG: CheA signal transduction histidine kinase [Conexibacter sp.]|nr:CheA signal transduction histidine kinase [Conexibacter sp.]
MDERLLEIFREEALERVDRMTAVLLAAEQGTGDAAAVAELFRDAHSIKGSASMLGHDEVGALAGAMEEVLAPARERGALGPAAVPALLGGVDAIRAAVTGDLGAIEPAVAALRDLLTGDAPPVPTRARRPASSAPTAVPARTAAPTPATAPAPARPATPQRMLRVRAESVDELLAAVGETALHERRFEHLAGRDRTVDEALHQELERGETLVGDLQDAVLGLRTLPLETVVGGLPRAVRDIATETEREVRLQLEGTDTPLDRSILDGIGELLVHLLRNAVSHGIEPPDEREALGKPRRGTIRIHAEQRGDLVAVTCADDGRGVSPELLERAREHGSLADLLAAPGFSTADAVSDLAGRGVGLDAVKHHVEGLGGSLEVTSEPGAGTGVTMLLPLTLAIVTVLLVERAGQPFGLPLSGIERAVRGERMHDLHGRRSLELDGTTVPLIDLADVLGTEAPALEAGAPVLIIASGGRRVAVACDRLLGDRETVVKSLGPLLAPVPGYLGATILGDGGIALLLDPAHLVRAADTVAAGRERSAAAVSRPAPKVLVVDDQFTVRELERTILEAAGYRVCTAEDGLAALTALDREVDVECVVSDVEMPGMGGLELLEAIRGQAGRSTLPVVIVTSRDDAQMLAKGADAGADAWVVKSQFDQQALLDTVGRLISLQ